MAIPDKDVPQMDAKELYLEETFTDRRVGTIRRLTPVKPDGTPDASRKQSFVGEASLMLPTGALPLNFEIPATDLAGAVAGFGDALQKGLAEAMEELKEMRRRATSQIVIPQGGVGGLGQGPGLPPGKLKL